MNRNAFYSINPLLMRQMNERATAEASAVLCVRLIERTNSITESVCLSPVCAGDHGSKNVFTFLSVQCNSWHWTDIKSIECLSVCLSVRLSVRPNTYRSR